MEELLQAVGERGRVASVPYATASLSTSLFSALSEAGRARGHRLYQGKGMPPEERGQEE